MMFTDILRSSHRENPGKVTTDMQELLYKLLF